MAVGVGASDGQTAPLESYAAFFAFAQRARCAAAIFLRAEADMVRLGFASLFVALFAHRAFCAKLIRRLPAALIPLRLLCGALPFDARTLKTSAACWSLVISASTSAKNLEISICLPRVRSNCLHMITRLRILLHSLHSQP
jgi:hypothetical protein